jgi:hypothetical protein
MGHPPGRYPAHCSAEFGLSSLPILPRQFQCSIDRNQIRKTGVAEWAERSSGPAAYLLSIGQETRLVYAVAWLGGLLLWSHREGIDQQCNTDEERDNPD